MDVYGKVTKPYWDDRPVAIIAGGPSLVGFDFERLRGCHVLAVKSSIFNIPWADAGFGLDMPRYAEWREKLSHVQSRVYWAVPEDQLQRTGPPPSKNITFVRRLVGENISADPGEIYGGGTSAFGAFQICLHKRAKTIGLFGFDYDGGNDGAKAIGSKQSDQHNKWRVWANHFSVYVPYLTEHGISVFNACPQSAIACFQKVTLDDGVKMLGKKINAAA